MPPPVPKRFSNQSTLNAQFHNDNWDLIFDGNYVLDTAHTSIYTAVAYIGSSSKTLVVNSRQRLTRNLVLPPNVHIQGWRGGGIDLNGYSITLTGFDCPAFRFFYGSGTVNFTLGAIEYNRPEWFGADPTGSTDSTAAIQRCLDCILISGLTDTDFIGRYAPDVMFVGKYKILSPGVIMNRRCSLLGVDQRASWIEYGSLTGACITIGFTISGGTAITASGTAGANTLVVSNASGIAADSIIAINSTKETYRAKSVLGTTVTLHSSLVRTYASVAATKNCGTTDNIGVDGYTSNLSFRNLKIEAAVSLGDPLDFPGLTYNGATNVGIYSGSLSHRLTFENCVIQRFFKGIVGTDSITQRLQNVQMRVCGKAFTFPYVAQSAANVMMVNCGVGDNRVGFENLPIGSTVSACVFEGNRYSAIGSLVTDAGDTIGAMGDNCRLVGNWFEGTKDCIRGDFYNAVIIGPGVMSSNTAGLFYDYTFDLATRNTFIQISPYGGNTDPINLLPESRLGRVPLKGGVGVQGSGGGSYAASVDAIAFKSNTDLYASRNGKDQRLSWFDKHPSITAGKRISGDLAPDVTGTGVYMCGYPLNGYGCTGTPSQATDAFNGVSGNRFISIAYDGTGFEAEDSILLPAAATTTATGTINSNTAVVASATNIIAGSRIVFSGTSETITVDSLAGTTLTLNKKLRQSYSGTTITIYHPVTVIAADSIATTATGTVGANTLTVVTSASVEVLGVFQIQPGFRLKLRSTNEEVVVRSIAGSTPTWTLTLDANLAYTYAAEVVTVVPVHQYSTTATGSAGSTALTLASGVGFVAGDLIKLPLEDAKISSITGGSVTLAAVLANNVSGGACHTTKAVISAALSYTYAAATLISDLCEWMLAMPYRQTDGSNYIPGATTLDGRIFGTSDLTLGYGAESNPNGAARYITLRSPLTGAERVDLNLMGHQTADGLLLAIQAMNGATNMGYIGFGRYGADNTSMAEIRVRAAGTDTPSFRFEPTRNISNTRLETSKGADVTAANDLTLGTDGNKFIITGNTQINGIAVANWQGGSEIDLLFSGTPTIKHNTAPSAGFAKLFLSGSVDLVAAANTCLTLWYDGTQWQEKCRKVA